MVEYSEQVRKTYSGMETEELLGRAKSGTLTEEAHALALEELKARDVPASELPIQSSPPSTPEPGFFWRCWHGKERLWKAWWLLGALVGLIDGLTRIPSSQLVQAALFLLVVLPIQVFQWVSVWRCAFRSSHWSWAFFARGSVIVAILVYCVIILRAF